MPASRDSLRCLNSKLIKTGWWRVHSRFVSWSTRNGSINLPNAVVNCAEDWFLGIGGDCFLSVVHSTGHSDPTAQCSGSLGHLVWFLGGIVHERIKSNVVFGVLLESKFVVVVRNVIKVKETHRGKNQQ